MRVDFYQLSRDPAEATLPLIARNVLAQGERLLVISGDEEQLKRIGEALWTRLPETFLANGRAGDEHEARQPILLSDRLEPGNGAKYCAMADGLWRDGDAQFERVFFLFDETTLHDARKVWTMLGKRGGLERRFWKQEAGRWKEGP